MDRRKPLAKVPARTKRMFPLPIARKPAPVPRDELARVTRLVLGR